MTPATTTSPPISSPATGISPSQTNAISTAKAGTRYSSDVAATIGNRPTAYPQSTNPRADGRTPRKATDHQALGDAVVSWCQAEGRSGIVMSVPATMA
jgi:hypothetical protein